MPFVPNPVHKYSISRHVGIPPNILFEVVSDVKSYKNFIPFVTESFISQYDLSTNLPQKAGFRIGWKDYDEYMVCDVTCQKDKLVFSEVTSSMVFDTLQNEWRFESVQSGPSDKAITKVSLNLQYRFKNPLFNSVSSIFQSQVSEIMVDSFLRRANAKQNEKDQ